MSPSYDLRAATRADVLDLFIKHHGYKSLGSSTTYCFAVFERVGEDAERPVAAFVWQPPPPGAAVGVCPEAPAGVLALSRMVAVPREQRALKHISKPLRRQMMRMIDRGRWPVLVTYSDEGQGHTGHVYKCSGWQKTVRSKRPVRVDANGARASLYANGRYAAREGLIIQSHTWLQRWEQWACERGKAAEWMAAHGWRRVRREGKVWANGRPAFTWARVG